MCDKEKPVIVSLNGAIYCISLNHIVITCYCINR